MKVAYIARSTLYTSRGGDTIQMEQTARHLEQLGIRVDIRLADEKIEYARYDLLHFFNLTRPADILPHISRSDIPFAVTPLLIDYSEFDRRYRTGIAGALFSHMPAGRIEYLKTIGRWVKGQQTIKGISYLLNGHRQSIKKIISRAAMFLPNSYMEYHQLAELYAVTPSFTVVPNGIDDDMFQVAERMEKDENMVLCAARIEGLKNQYRLIQALNNTRFQLFLIGNAAKNQSGYLAACKKIAAPNVHFITHLPQEKLIRYYQKAKVHVLPSWFETCGLSTLEAAAMGCNVVITNRGYAAEYCRGHAFFCDPASPSSILDATRQAAEGQHDKVFQQEIFCHYTWRNAAVKTYEAYKKITNET